MKDIFVRKFDAAYGNSTQTYIELQFQYEGLSEGKNASVYKNTPSSPMDEDLVEAGQNDPQTEAVEGKNDGEENEGDGMDEDPH